MSEKSPSIKTGRNNALQDLPSSEEGFISQEGKVSPPLHPDEVYTDQDTVRCDGSGGALGHPAIYLPLEKGEIMCPYCSKKFILKIS